MSMKLILASSIFNSNKGASFDKEIKTINQILLKLKIKLKLSNIRCFKYIYIYIYIFEVWRKIQLWKKHGAFGEDYIAKDNISEQEIAVKTEDNLTQQHIAFKV